MLSGPDRFKQDARSPQQLTKAILDHELTPRGVEPDGIPYNVTFREQLLMDYLTDGREGAGYGDRLVIALKSLEAGSALTRRQKDTLGHALEVIDAYKKEAAGFRDDSARRAAGGGRESDRRAEAEAMEENMVEIGNLNAIEKLVRALAEKLDVSLIEPGLEK